MNLDSIVNSSLCKLSGFFHNNKAITVIGLAVASSVFIGARLLYEVGVAENNDLIRGPLPHFLLTTAISANAYYWPRFMDYSERARNIAALSFAILSSAAVETIELVYLNAPLIGAAEDFLYIIPSLIIYDVLRRKDYL